MEKIRIAPVISAKVSVAVPANLERIYFLERMYSQNPWNKTHILDELSNPNSIFLILSMLSPPLRQSAMSTVSNTLAHTNEIIGFACSVLILSELQILEVVVEDGYRGVGFGSMLINDLLSKAAAKDAGRACLEVRASNFSAIRVYEKCGFAKDTVRKKYYQDGEDAVLMSRAIP